MWQWHDNTMELYHYGVKGMRWGVRRNRSMNGGEVSKELIRAGKAAVDSVWQ